RFRQKVLHWHRLRAVCAAISIKTENMRAGRPSHRAADEKTQMRLYASPPEVYQYRYASDFLKGGPMNRRITGFVLCLSVATLSQAAMAQPGQGRGGQMRDMIPGEQMRQEAGRSGDVRRDVPQRERREYQQPQRDLNQSEMARLRER